MDIELKEHGINLREQMLKFISDYILKNNYAPTIREIAKAVDLKSVSSVHSHLVQLEIEGLIEMVKYKPRGIKVIGYK